MNHLGRGIYSQSEVARFTNVPRTTIRNWLHGAYGGVGRGPVISNTKTATSVTFLQMIELRVVQQLRNHGITLPNIRPMYTKIAKELSTKYPFAQRRFYTDGKAVFLNVLSAQHKSDESLVEVLTGQHAMPSILKQFLAEIHFNHSSGIAESWSIAKGIAIDPRVSLGKPIVQGTRSATYVINQALIANDYDADLVAALYDLTTEDVLNAAQFEASFARAA